MRPPMPNVRLELNDSTVQQRSSTYFHCAVDLEKGTMSQKQPNTTGFVAMTALFLTCEHEP